MRFARPSAPVRPRRAKGQVCIPMRGFVKGVRLSTLIPDFSGIRVDPLFPAFSLQPLQQFSILIQPQYGDEIVMVRAFDGDELLGLGRKAEKLLTLRERND